VSDSESDSGSPESPDNREKTPPEGKREGGRFSNALLVGGLAGGLLAVVFVVAIVRKGEGSTLPRLGGAVSIPQVGKGVEGTPSIISPVGSIPHGAMSLQWTRVRGLDTYEALIYDNQGQILWRSGKIQSDHVDVPPSALDIIVPRASHFWRVIAYEADGSEDSSPSVQFIVSP